MSVQRIQLEVHGTGEGEADTYTEEDGAVSVDTDIEVGDEDIVHRSTSLITEECVWHPNFARFGDCQIFYLV